MLSAPGGAVFFLLKFVVLIFGDVFKRFVRAAARSARVVARLTAEDIKTMRVITGLANNLNQLTKLAHKDGILTVVIQCGQVLTELHEALKYFNRHDRQDT